ncbi:MAG: helix-turn-helix domain-containing protein [Myxococcota bacterium]
MNAPLDGFAQEPASFETLGGFLRRERELRAVSLEEIALTTRIPLRALRHIEDDQFDELPGAVFTRGFLQAYARALGLDPSPLIARFDFKRPTNNAPAFVAKGATPERGRRFGVAIAVVVLLILFTLALSIVLRPRHRDVPVELSHQATPTDVFRA